MTTARSRPRMSGRRPGSAARLRAVLRLARRQIAHSRAASILVAALIAIPIAGMTAFTVWGASLQPTPEERSRVELGQAQAWVSPVGVPGAGFQQAPLQPLTFVHRSADGTTVTPSGVPLTDPTSVLPPGTRTIPTIEGGTVRVRTADGVAGVRAWSGQTWDPALAGRFDLVDGRRPVDTDEAMVTPATLERIGIGLGERITLTQGRMSFTVVGTLDAAAVPDSEAGVFLPRRAGLDIPGAARWYLPDHALTWQDVRSLNTDGVAALSRSVILDPPDDVPAGLADLQSAEESAAAGRAVGIGLGGVFAAYVVVMLAGSAFGVATQRQQRALAVVASVGASRGDLFRTVLLQGLALGAWGGVAGVAIGLGVAAMALTATDDGSGTQPWGFHIPWLGLIAILAFATIVGTAAAVAPARRASRADTMRALRGARRPQRPTTRRALWGPVVMTTGAVVTIVSGAILIAVAAGDENASMDSPFWLYAVLGIAAGPVLVQLGILLSGRWLLTLLARVLSRVSVAARIASRDGAANPGRTVPVLSAISAVVFLGIFAISAVGMATANQSRLWAYTAPVNSFVIQLSPNAAEGEAHPWDVTSQAEAAAAAREVAEAAGAHAVATVSRQSVGWYAEEFPVDAVQAIALAPRPSSDDAAATRGDSSDNIAVISAEDVAVALGVDLTAAELAAYRAGAAIVAEPQLLSGGAVEVGAWSLVAISEGRGPFANEVEPGGPPLWQHRLETVPVDAPPGPIAVALSPETAAELGLSALPASVIATFDGPPSPATQDRIREAAAAAATPDYALSAEWEAGPPSDLPWLLPLVAGLAVLVIGASAVALSLSRVERRPDEATLVAVGAAPRMRRRIGLWQGLVVAGFGTLTGALTGILPAIGVSLLSDSSRLSDAPWLVLAAIVVALPLVIAGTNALIPSRNLELTRRTAIA